MRPRNLTILLSDVKGYTERQSRSSRREIEDEVRRHRDLLAPIFSGFGGRVVKTMGDAFLVAFESPTDAVHAAVQVQKALAAENTRRADPAAATHVRIAISTGEVTVDEHGDVFGEPVNLAARLEDIAEAGTIYLTETTFLSMNRNEIPALEVGHRVFKGIPDEVKVYRILDDFVARARLLSPEEIRSIGRAAPVVAPRRRTAAWVAAGAAGAVLAGGASWALFRPSPPPAPPPAPATAGDLVDAVVRAAAKDPKSALAAAALVRRQVEAMAKAGDWDGARALARRASDAVPDLPGPRDFLIDLSRLELEDAAERGALDDYVKQDPPAWHDANVAARADAWKASPRYAWLRATWALAKDPVRDEAADLAEAAAAANDDARRHGPWRTFLASAVAATVGTPRLHRRYQDLLAAAERAGPALDAPPTGPRPGVGRRGPGMRDR